MPINDKTTIKMKYLTLYRLNMIPPEINYNIIDNEELCVDITAGPISFSYSVPVSVYHPPCAIMTM